MKEPVIDVSHWDGSVNYALWIKKFNLWGVIVKCGGNETKLGRYTDPQYENNYKRAKAAGLHVGAYYYTVCTSVAEAKKDAEHIIGLLKGHEFDMPIYMDVEDPRQFKLSKRELTDVIKAFCNTLIKAGYYAGLYIQGSAWLNNVYKDELDDYANWIAWWRESWPTEAGDIGMWQQGTKNLGTGKVYYEDVSGSTDFNWCAIDYPSRIKNNQKKYEEEKNAKKDEQSKKDIEKTEQNKKQQQEDEKKVATDNKLTKFCEWMYIACAVWSLGYDQYQRQNIYDGGECDCSSLVIWALQKAGFDVGTSSYTGNMSANLTKRGWVRLPADLSTAKPGDILLNDTYHVAVVISGNGWNAKIAQASIDERGRITGGQTGDQTGNETNVKNIYTYSHGWSCILRYQGSTTNGVNSNSSNQKNTSTQLTVDGIGGYVTIKKWQQSLGTVADGIISGQLKGNQKYFSGIVSVTWERTGSELVKAIQKKVGTTSDGYWGPATSKAIQNFLMKKGYDIGVSGVDGYFGSDSVKALQKSLNSKNNPWK